jgi:hypothetical protein
MGTKREVSQEIYNEEKARDQKKKKYNPLIYDFLPKEDGRIGHNRLYLGIFDTSQIKTLKSLKKASGSWTFSYGIFTHYQYDQILKTGHNIICQNPGKNMFINPKSRCPLCAIADKIYDVRKKWQGTRSYEAVKEDPIYKQISEKGKKFIAVKKLPYVCLDIDKLLNKKPLNEYEQEKGLAMQVVGMPNAVDKQIRALYEGGYKFYDIIEEMDSNKKKIQKVCVVNITRDNTKGSRNAVYSCVIEKDPIAIPTDWIECITNDIPDPIDILFKSIETEDDNIWFNDLCERIAPSDEEIKGYVNLQQSDQDSISISIPTPSHQNTQSAGVAAPRKKIDSESIDKDLSNEDELEPKNEAKEIPSTESPKKRRRILFDDEGK